LHSRADKITGRSFQLALIAVRITVQVYLYSSLAFWNDEALEGRTLCGGCGCIDRAHPIVELAIALFGPESGAALATVVGVLMVSARHAVPSVQRAIGHGAALGGRRW
jgi:arsenite transporter